MPIQMIAKDNPALFYPVVFCDQCGQRIENYRKMNVVFSSDEMFDENGNTEMGAHLHFTHKGVCDRTFEMRHMKGDYAWEEGRQFLEHLLHNVGFKRVPAEA